MWVSELQSLQGHYPQFSQQYPIEKRLHGYAKEFKPYGAEGLILVQCERGPLYTDPNGDIAQRKVRVALHAGI